MGKKNASKIQVVISNPELLDTVSDRYTKLLTEIYFKRKAESEQNVSTK